MNEVNYKDSHRFPSGLEINYDSEVEKEYIDDRDAISTKEDLEYFRKKWMYLFPELANANIDVETFTWLRSSHELQDKLSNDLELGSYFDLLAPYDLINFCLLAEKYGVTTGVVVLQLWNGGQFREAEDGSWELS